MKAKIELNGLEANYSGRTIEISSDDNTVEKELFHPEIQISVADDSISVETQSTKNDVKSLVNTYSSIISNAVKGLQEEYEYNLEAVYAHFPMSIDTDNNQVVIENFMGEQEPRRADILEGVSVAVDNENLTVTGPDKQKVGQTAANIEQACKKGNRDPRTFQDGIYIVGDEK